MLAPKVSIDESQDGSDNEDDDDDDDDEQAEGMQD
jgi:hypothetical protein